MIEADGLTRGPLDDIVRPMIALPKQTVERDGEYLSFVRSLPCSVCSRPSPSHAHHHPLPGHSSVGSKTSDYRTMPLCGSCHSAVHQRGRLTFWGNLEVPEELIERLNKLFFFGA